ncbi:hypothetical protein M0805_005001, partial [Coniferiporia weirii]
MADTVKTDLVYSLPPADGSKPYQTVNSDPKTGQRQRNYDLKKFETEVENIRGREDSYTLDTAGFQFARNEAKHRSFANDEEVEREYYPESIELLKKLTGASRVVLFDHTIRRRRPGEIDDGPQKRQPVPLVHV